MTQIQAEAMARVVAMHVEVEASVRSLLTPEQLEKPDCAKACRRQAQETDDSA